MGANNLLDTSTTGLSDIIGNGKLYKVPSFQRDYSWNRDNWEDLWNDILSVIGTNQVHYMGSIVLQNIGEKNFSIIDGQQRLATLTLIILATIKNIQQLIDRNIDKENNIERINLLTKKFLGDKDPASLTYSAKLLLNENNNSFFQSHLMVFRPPNNEKTLGDSNLLLWKAYNFFLGKVSEYFKESDTGEQQANFLNKQIAEKLIFIQIIVQDELSAYTVFETLNYRGERLTLSDLLKNFLFSLASQNDLEHIKIKWKATVDIVGLDKFPAFLHRYWISKNKLISEKSLFKALKNTITSSTEVIDLIDELEKFAQIYNALSNSSHSIWQGKRNIKERIREIELFKEKQALPLLMAAYDRLTQDEFAKVLKVITTITFRYTVIGNLHSNLKEEIYNSVAIKINSGELLTANAIACELKKLYTSDVDFKNDFSTFSINTKLNKKLVRYVLFLIENHLSGADNDFELSPATIEHILPENPNEDWNEYFPLPIIDSYVFRIGNYALLEDEKNKKCEIKPYLQKLDIYKTSQYYSTNSIDFNEWNPNAIEARQMQLAKTATAVWRIPYFD